MVPSEDLGNLPPSELREPHRAPPLLAALEYICIVDMMWHTSSYDVTKKCTDPLNLPPPVGPLDLFYYSFSCLLSFIRIIMSQDQKIKLHTCEKVGLLEEFLLYKFKMKQPILREDMLKIVSPKYQNQFAEILRKVSEHIEVVFAVDLKKVNPTHHLYDLVSKLKLPNNGRIHAGKGLPKTGLLMTLLSVIFLKGNCANEEDIWQFLNMMQICVGKKYYLYGEPRKLITQDFVKLKYLEYCQVPSSYPAYYKFLWVTRVYSETSKMKVLEYLAKVSNIAPGTFSSQYEEALMDEEERAQARIAAKTGTTAVAKIVSRPSSTASPNPTEV
nr:melanoma-associated antigen B5 [Aotus nancymaae]